MKNSYQNRGLIEIFRQMRIKVRNSLQYRLWSNNSVSSDAYGGSFGAVRSLILEIQERIKSCRVRDVVDKETQAISSVKESVVEDQKEA